MISPLAVLISVSEFVKGKSLPSIFTFKRELVMDWLVSAKQACCLPTYMAEEGYYGGPPFVDPDPSTHWSEPHQLYTWWKNNVERRSKFKVLQEDARYKGLDPRRLQRYSTYSTTLCICAWCMFCTSLLLLMFMFRRPLGKGLCKEDNRSCCTHNLLGALTH